MRATTTDAKVLMTRLGAGATKALEGAIRRAMSAGHAEITTDHLLRALLDLPDADFRVSMEAARIGKIDVAARLDAHLARAKGGHKGKPSLAQSLLLWLEDASKLTSDKVRTGHLAAALLADPKLSPGGMAGLFGALPREPLYLLTSKFEDRGEVGRAPAAPAAGAAPAAPRDGALGAATSALLESTSPAASDAAARAPAVVAPAGVRAPAAAAPSAGAPATAAGSERAPKVLAALRALFAERVESESAAGLTLSARVAGRATTLRIDYDSEARAVVLRIGIPGSPPADPARAAGVLAALNNAIPYGAFTLDEGRIAFRSHVFLDAAGDAPADTVVYAARVCEEAAETLFAS